MATDVRGSFLDADHPATGSLFHAASHQGWSAPRKVVLPEVGFRARWRTNEWDHQCVRTCRKPPRPIGPRPGMSRRIRRRSDDHLHHMHPKSVARLRGTLPVPRSSRRTRGFHPRRCNPPISRLAIFARVLARHVPTLSGTRGSRAGQSGNWNPDILSVHIGDPGHRGGRGVALVSDNLIATGPRPGNRSTDHRSRQLAGPGDAAPCTSRVPNRAAGLSRHVSRTRHCEACGPHIPGRRPDPAGARGRGGTRHRGPRLRAGLPPSAGRTRASRGRRRPGFGGTQHTRPERRGR